LSKSSATAFGTSRRLGLGRLEPSALRFGTLVPRTNMAGKRRPAETVPLGQPSFSATGPHFNREKHE